MPELIEKTDELGKRYEPLLGKYVSVWLWSILFGSITGVGYSFSSYRPFDTRFRISLLLSALLFLIGALAALSALLALYRALVRYLLPQFVMHEEGDPRLFADSLRHALYMFIIAVITRVIMALVDALLTGLGAF